MGLHGKGLWGHSLANVKGTRRFRCPLCGQRFVIGSRNRHNTNFYRVEKGKSEYGLGSLVLQYEPQNPFYCPVTGKYVDLKTGEVLEG